MIRTFSSRHIIGTIMICMFVTQAGALPITYLRKRNHFSCCYRVIETRGEIA